MVTYRGRHLSWHLRLLTSIPPPKGGRLSLDSFRVYPLTSLPLPPTSREDLRFGGYLEYPHAMKDIYVYKHPCLLQDSNPSPTPPPLATILDE
ncbi:hypothetical protein TNCV_507571 [Trichonephila clavipes]|nr:hypothetical protein TNCV_507571 [Trichonephila clavipes]